MSYQVDAIAVILKDAGFPVQQCDGKIKVEFSDRRYNANDVRFVLADEIESGLVNVEVHHFGSIVHVL